MKKGITILACKRTEEVIPVVIAALRMVLEIMGKSQRNLILVTARMTALLEKTTITEESAVLRRLAVT